MAARRPHDRSPIAVSPPAAAARRVPRRRTVRGAALAMGGARPPIAVSSIVPLDQLVVRSAGDPAPVVRAELVAVLGVLEVRLVELRGVLDLVLRAVDEHRLGVVVDAVDEAGRNQDLLAEDPGAGIDDEEATAHLGRRLVHLADLPVAGLDLEARHGLRRNPFTERPHVDTNRHLTPLRSAL